MRNVTVRFNHLPKIKAAMPNAIAATVRDAALKCETYAKDVVPVDTGALKASVRAEQESELAWTVAPATEYAIYVEFGTRRMSAQPYMRPAAEKIRQEYPDLVVETVVRVVKDKGAWFRDNAPDVTVEERAAGT